MIGRVLAPAAALALIATPTMVLAKTAKHSHHAKHAMAPKPAKASKAK